MDSTKPDLSQPELPAPNEKLLRAPTFFEKYGWMKSVIVVALIVLLIDAAIYFILRSDTQDLGRPQNEKIQVTPSLPTTQSWPTYVSEQGGFMLEYPEGGIVNTNTSVSPYGIQLTSPIIPELNTTYRLTIVYKPISQNQSLNMLIAQNKICPNISPENAMSSTINGEKEAALYIDTQCGPLVKTVIYTMNNNMFYMITIETEAKFAEIKPYTDQVLSTLTFMNIVPVQSTRTPSPSNMIQECTADALLCADGSSVGRTGPNCEFAACPKR